MKKSFRILLIVAVVLNVALIAAFTVPVKHTVNFEFVKREQPFDFWNKYVDGEYIGTEYYFVPDPPSGFTYSNTTINWNSPSSIELDLSWLPFSD